MKKVSKRKPAILILLNLLIILPFLFVCLSPFMINSEMSWLVSMTGMGFPYLLALLIIFLIIWIIRRALPFSGKMLLLNAAVLLLGFQQIRSVFGFHFFSRGEVTERTAGIRVMSWNVTGWDIGNWDKKNHRTDQPLMFDLIEQTNPDVLLLQEFFNCTDPGIVESYLDLLVQRGYPYFYFTPYSVTVEGKFQFGPAIFSRYPVSDTAYFFPESAGHSEGFQYADITIREKKIRFFNTHLESAGMSGGDVSGLARARGGHTVFSKLKYTHHIRMNQARELKEQMDRSPFPVVLGGDIGELPNSTTYFLLRKNMQDAFNKKGSGIGRTFPYIVPNLRIDYLFISPEFKVETFFVVNKKYSVHYPIISDISE